MQRGYQGCNGKLQGGGGGKFFGLDNFFFLPFSTFFPRLGTSAAMNLRDRLDAAGRRAVGNDRLVVNASTLQAAPAVPKTLVLLDCIPMGKYFARYMGRYFTNNSYFTILLLELGSPAPADKHGAHRSRNKTDENSRESVWT